LVEPGKKQNLKKSSGELSAKYVGAGCFPLLVLVDVLSTNLPLTLDGIF